MTAEDRAAKIVAGERWFDSDYFTDASGEEYRTERVNADTLQREIADAIRAAVAEERERCASLKPLLPIPDPRGSTWGAQEQAIEAYRAAIRAIESGTSAGGGT